MSAAVLYLLKAHAVLALAAGLYYGLLRQLTFLGLNRAFLLGALGLAAAGPALPGPPLALTSMPAVAAWAGRVPAPAATAGPPAPTNLPAVDWKRAALGLYAVGVAVGLAALLAQLAAVARLRRRTALAVLHGQPYRRLNGDDGPFSFGATIYLNPDRHPAAELLAVLRHEQAHVRQGHTADVLLAQLAVALAWCNPAAWLLRRAVLDNLEYLADRAALQAGLDRRAYQYSLLRLSAGAAGPSLVSHFTFLTLKNRVVMMNSAASSAAQAGRYLLAVPLVLGLTLGFNAVQAQGPAASAVAVPPAGTPVYYVDGQLADGDRATALKPEAIASVNVLKPELARQVFGEAGAAGAVVVTTKANANALAVLSLNAKLNKVAPLVPGTERPAEVNVLTPAALAYITKNFPDARLNQVTQLTYPGTGQTVYKVELITGRRPSFIFFDERGQVVKN